MPNNQRTIFTCPNCEHEEETLEFSEPVTGTERGSYDIGDDHHEYDGDTDLDRNGDRTYSCRECGEEIDYDEIQRHITRPEQRATGLAITSQDASAEENEGSNNVRIMDLKTDATGDAISSTQTRECRECQTLISGVGSKNKFVVCPNPKCAYEFDKTEVFFSTLTPALQ